MAVLSVTCPQCAMVYTIDETHRGKKGQCKKCNTSFVIDASPSNAKERPQGEDGIPLDWEPGDIILDLYEVLKLPGTEHGFAEGGMGRVNRVRHREWQRDLAVKSVKLGKSANARDIDHFKTEAEQWVDKIGLHPNIVACHYVRVLGGVPRVFIEYVEGGSLHQWITSRRLYEGGHKAALARILDVAIQTAWGLHYVHELGLIHQDVKPLNMMMTADGIAKVTDFGLAGARAVASGDVDPVQAGQSLMATGAGLMTPAYCSPEQADIQAMKKAGTPAERWPKLTRRTDLWSWAASVLHMFLGKVDWPGGQVAHVGLLQEPDEPHLPPMPPAVRTLLQECFKRRPEDRPHNLMEVADALVTHHSQVTGQPYARDRPDPARALADTLNNRAVSLFDLGKREEADRVWEQALRADLRHLEATYNGGLSFWRSGRMDDIALLNRFHHLVETYPDPAWARQALALFHLERDDCPQAIKLLIAAAQEGGRPEITEALTQARTQLSQAAAPQGERYLAVGPANTPTGTLRLWEVAPARERFALAGEIDDVRAFALSPDGTFALVGGNSSKWLEMWDLAKGQRVGAWEADKEGIRDLHISAAAPYALTVSWNGVTRLWDLTRRKCLRVLAVQQRVEAAALSPDARHAVTASAQEVKFWELDPLRCVRTVSGHGPDASCAYTRFYVSPTGKWVLSGGLDGVVKCRDLTTGATVCTLKGHFHAIVTSLSMIGDTHVIASCSGAASLSSHAPCTKVWERSSGRCLRTFARWSLVDAVHLDLERGLLLQAEGGVPGQLHLKEVTRTERDVKLFRAPFLLSCSSTAPAALTADRAFRAALASADAALQRGDLNETTRALRQARDQPGYRRDQEVVKKWSQHTTRVPRGKFVEGWTLSRLGLRDSAIGGMSVSPNGRYVLCGFADHSLELLDLVSGKCVQTFADHPQEVAAVAFSGSSRVVVSGEGAWARSREGANEVISLRGHASLRAWDPATGRCLTVMDAHSGGIRSLSVTHDGAYAISSNDDQICHLWDLETGRCLRMWSLAAASEDTASGSIKSAAEIQDEGTDTGVDLGVGLDLPESGHKVSITPDSRRVVSAQNNVVTVWEARSRRPSASHVMPGHVSCLCLSPRGRWIIAGGSNGALRIWDIKTGQIRFSATTPHRIEALALTADDRYLFVVGTEDNGLFNNNPKKELAVWDVATVTCVFRLTRQGSTFQHLQVAPHGKYAVWVTDKHEVEVFYLDWELEPVPSGNWEEAVGASIDDFLTLHTPYVGTLPKDREPTEEEITRALTRRGQPRWEERDFQRLLYDLSCAGFGWVRPEDVRGQLDRRAAGWQGNTAFVP